MATNLLRRRHGVPDLAWSETLAADARAWAHTLAQSNTFEHDYNSMQVKSQGENLAFFKPFKEKCQGPKRDDCVQCREIIEGWYDEVKNYDFGMGKPKAPGGVVMHFTQVSTSCLNGNNLNSSFKIVITSQNLLQAIEAYVTFLIPVPFPPVCSVQ